MGCGLITGTNNPGNSAHVNSAGQVETHSVILTEESMAAERGELFNLTTGAIELTNDVETPFFYLKNVGESRSLKLTSITITLARNTGAPGDPVFVGLYSNPTGGTLLNAADLPLANFNIGSGNIIDVITKVGGVGDTITSVTSPVPIMLPNDSQRYTVDTDSIVIPKGRSVALTITAPTGTSSMLAVAAVNFHQIMES